MSTDVPGNVNRKRRGRIPLGYSEKCKRGKLLEESQLAEELKKYPFELTMRAVCKYLRDFGEHDMAFVIDKMIREEEKVAEIKSRVILKNVPLIKPLTPVDSLSLLLECKLTKHQYMLIRQRVNSCGTKLFPGYDGVVEAKKACRPQDITIDEEGKFAFVKLQSLISHTIQRIIQGIKAPILVSQNRRGVLSDDVTLYGSYGMDGSTGHSLYKMKMGSSTNYDPDASLFTSSFIPLKMTRTGGGTVWVNSRAQSTRLCRPIRLQFAKETPELILNEQKWIEDQVKSLSCVVVPIDATHFVKVSCDLSLTVIDGKVLAVITGTKSFQTCPICGANPSKFNDPRQENSELFKPIPGRLRYGVSPLHCWIRFFEFLLRLGYRMELKKWRIEKKDQPRLLERKHRIQRDMQDKLGLKVDFPAQNGAGTTNDGNTSRRSFEKAEEFADILGVDRKLVKGLHTILICFASQQKINSIKFKEHCQQLLLHYISLYPWCYLSATVHKILVHGADIITESILPVGMLGEEGAESRNKNYKEDRERFTRKMSRQKNMEDLFNRALDTSDPVMSNITAETRQQMKRKKPLPLEVRSLLILPHPNIPGTGQTIGETETTENQDFYDTLDQISLDAENDDLA